MADAADYASVLDPTIGNMTALQKEQVARTQALSKILGQKSAIDTSPIYSPIAGWARVVQGALEGYADKQERDRQNQLLAAGNAAFLQRLGRGSGTLAGGTWATGHENDDDTPSSGSGTAGPQKTSEYDPKSIPSFVAAASGLYPSLPADYLPKVASIESAGDPGAHNKSGASGLFQFTPGTAQAMGLSNPYDPVASTHAAARLALQNGDILRSNLGRDPTGGELYLAHQQGPAGASALLANPSANVVDALAPAYGGNRGRAAAAITANSGSVGMTAGQFSGLWTGKYDARRAKQASLEGDAADAPDASDVAAAPTEQTAQADLPASGAAPVAFDAMRSFAPDSGDTGFFIPPASQPAADVSVPAPDAPGPLGSDLGDQRPVLSSIPFAGGVPAPPIGADVGTDARLLAGILSPPASIPNGSAVSGTPAPNSFSAPVLPATDTPPIPPARPADLARVLNGDVTPSPDWRTATASPGQDARAAGQVADASGTIVPSSTSTTPTPQDYARALMPDLSNRNDAGVGDFNRLNSGSPAAALASVLSGQPAPAAAAAAPVSYASATVPAPAPAPLTATPVAPVRTAATAPVVAAPTAASATDDPEVKVDGYDGTWTRAKVAAAARRDPNRDGIPEDSELAVAQRPAPTTNAPVPTGPVSLDSPADRRAVTARAGVPGAPMTPPIAGPGAGASPQEMAQITALAASPSPVHQKLAQEMASNIVNRKSAPQAWNGGIAQVGANGEITWVLKPDELGTDWERSPNDSGVFYNKDDPNKWIRVPGLSGPKAADLTPALIPDGQGGQKPNPNAVQRRPDGSIVAPFQGGQTINVNSIGETEDAKRQAKRRNDPLDEAVEGAKGVDNQRESLAVMRNAFLAAKANGGELPQGYFGDDIQRLKSAARSFGLDLGNVGPGEVVQKMNAVLAAASSQSVSARGGTQFEFKTFLGNNPGLSQTPEGRMALIDILDGLAERKQAVSRIARARDTTPDNFDDRVAGYDAAHPIVNPFAKDKPLTDKDVIGPPQPAGARPAPSATISVVPPQQAVDALRGNPGLREQFDNKYGPGAASRILGGR